MNPRLLERAGESQRVREIPLTGDQFLIGRDDDCDLRLHVSEISRHHCLIHTAPDEVTITDLGSSNGTYVNGARVLSQTVLHTGDEIRLGPCNYVIDLGGDPHLLERLLKHDVDPKAVTSRIPPQKLAKKLHLDD